MTKKTKKEVTIKPLSAQAQKYYNEVMAGYVAQDAANRAVVQCRESISSIARKVRTAAGGINKTRAQAYERFVQIAENGASFRTIVMREAGVAFKGGKIVERAKAGTDAKKTGKGKRSPRNVKGTSVAKSDKRAGGADSLVKLRANILDRVVALCGADAELLKAAEDMLIDVVDEVTELVVEASSKKKAA